MVGVHERDVVVAELMGAARKLRALGVGEEFALECVRACYPKAEADHLMQMAGEVEPEPLGPLCVYEYPGSKS